MKFKWVFVIAALLATLLLLSACAGEQGPPGPPGPAGPAGPFAYGKVRAVDDELTACIAAAGVAMQTATDTEVNDAVVADFPAAVV